MIYYEDDAVRLYHGDCLDIIPQIGSVDHCIMDPPYGEHVHNKQWIGHALTKGRARMTGPGAHKNLDFVCLSDSLRKASASFSAQLAQRWVLVFSDIEGCHLWREALQCSGLEYIRTGIWSKPDAAPQFTGDRPGSGAEAITIAHGRKRKRWNGGGKKAVFEHYINNFGRSTRLHPTPKPESLMVELVTLFTDEGETILDPFAGSGTTGVAAKLNGRNAILIERDEKYCAIAAKRLRETEPGRLFENMPRAKPQRLLP